MQELKKARGAALLTALFIMTLVAIVAVAMSTRLQLDIYRTRLIITQDKLYLTSEVVLFWAIEELSTKKNEFTKANKQGVVLQFPAKMRNLADPIQVTGVLYDLQSRFNLNNLLEKKYTVSFLKLLSTLLPDLQDKEQLQLVRAIQHWLLPFNLALGKDEYTSYYLGQKPPYYPAHQLLASTSELRLIKMVNAPLYQTLQPFIIALPELTPININTAPLKVMMSLGNGLNQAQANELIAMRKEEGIKDLKEVAELINKMNLPLAQITIDSRYFLSAATVSSDEYKLVVYTLLKRTRDNNGLISVKVIRTSFNTF